MIPPKPSELCRRFLVTLPSGIVWQAWLYETSSRRTGRRIVVTDDDGATLFDSGDHYDLANASNALDRWLATIPEAKPCGV